MHELSVALGIVKIAEEQASGVNARSVDLIELEIGSLAGIELDALDMVWPAAVKGTMLENAEKRVNIIQGRAECNRCGAVFDVDQFYDPCPKCDSFQKNILFGKEMRVKTLEIS